MLTALEECETRALKLSAQERAQLIERLISSLDDDENLRVWVEEAERRSAAYGEGRFASRPAEDAIKDARSTLK